MNETNSAMVNRLTVSGHLRNDHIIRAFHVSPSHGVGLEIHEKPWISSISKIILKPGMVFTIEPGIYIKGKYGVRIEDDVLVTKSGCKVLSK